MIRFRSDNRIRYMQDHFMCAGVPSGVPFAVIATDRLIGGGYHLSADGYGSDYDYGNGNITIWTADVRPSVNDRLKTAAEAAKEE